MIKISNIIKEKETEIDKIFEKIKYKLNQGFYLIVEGKKDVKKLHLIGIKQNILAISQKSLMHFVEILPDAKGFILLTDFDRKGEVMARRLQDLLHKKKVEVDTNLRNSLKFYFKKYCKDIECVITIYLKTKKEWRIHEN